MCIRDRTELLRDPAVAAVEVGPGHSLTPYVRANPRWDGNRTAVVSTRGATDGRADQAVLLEALGSLWRAGVAVDWPAVYAGQGRRDAVLLWSFGPLGRIAWL